MRSSPALQRHPDPDFVQTCYLGVGAISVGRGTDAGRMPNIGLKAVGILLALRRHSKRRGNWTLSIAIFSTLVTIGLVALYLAQETTEFP
jgi:hypothetical protein